MHNHSVGQTLLVIVYDVLSLLQLRDTDLYQDQSKKIKNKRFWYCSISPSAMDLRVLCCFPFCCIALL